MNTNLLHGLRGPVYLQVVIPPLWICDSVEFSYRGVSASSFSASTTANSSAVASASSMMADAASALASSGTTYPNDTLCKSMRWCVEATARARRTPRRKVLLACSVIRPPSSRKRLITELPDIAPSPLELLAHAHGGSLKVSVLRLSRHERGAYRLFRRGLVRHPLPQL